MYPPFGHAAVACTRSSLAFRAGLPAGQQDPARPGPQLTKGCTSGCRQKSGASSRKAVLPSVAATSAGVSRCGSCASRRCTARCGPWGGKQGNRLGGCVGFSGGGGQLERALAAGGQARPAPKHPTAGTVLRVPTHASTRGSMQVQASRGRQRAADVATACIASRRGAGCSASARPALQSGPCPSPVSPSSSMGRPSGRPGTSSTPSAYTRPSTSEGCTLYEKETLGTLERGWCDSSCSIHWATSQPQSCRAASRPEPCYRPLTSACGCADPSRLQQVDSGAPVEQACAPRRRLVALGSIGSGTLRGEADQAVARGAGAREDGQAQAHVPHVKPGGRAGRAAASNGDVSRDVPRSLTLRKQIHWV